MLKSKNLLVAAVCLFFVPEISAQTAVTINETKTNAVLTEKAAEISLTIENLGKSFEGEISLELLDKDEQVRAKTSKKAKIKRGASTDKISLPLGDLMRTSQDDIGWFRLRYSVKTKNGNLQTAGIISLSEIIKDIFELRVTAAENVFAGMNYRVRARAVHPFTNAPIQNVKIAGELALDVDTDENEDKLKLSAEATTDADGFAILEFNIPVETKLEYDGELKVTGSKYGIVREIEQDLNSFDNDTSVFINTDKPIYQPGQILNVRGLLLKGAIGEKKIVGDAEIEFSVIDDDSTLLYKETVKTSAFGIAAISWTIPENAKLGEYNIRVKDEDGEGIGYENFKVTRYDLPNFTVETKSDRDFYLTKDSTANVTVSADYLFGKPVTRGKVRVVEESERSWNYRKQKWETEEGQVFEGETDADGKFTANIDLKKTHIELEKKSWRRYQDVHFAAYFTDLTTNRTEQRRFDLRLSKEAIHIYFIGRTYNNNPNLPLTFYVSTFYADGTPASCDVEIKGKYKNETSEKQIASIKTNRYGAGKLQFNAPQNSDISKDLELKITAFDEKGNIGTHDENIDFDTDDKIQINFGKTIFHDGETIKAEIVSSKKSGLIYIDVVKNWSVLDSHYVYLENGRAALEIPYKNYFKGELTIAAYTESVDDDGDLDLIKTSRGIIFPAPNNLRVDAKFSDSVYRPNEEATINFSVFAPDKSPIETALGIVVFDKAIEERARTDSEFGNYRGMFYGYRGLLGYGEAFGGLTKNDLNELDLRQPISDEIQLAAELMFYNNYYYPEINRSDDYTQARSVFAEVIEKQLAPVETVLRNAYADDFSHPTDDVSLREILSARNIDFDKLRDPWLSNYRAKYEVGETNDLMTIESAGADKKFDTRDDFTVLKMSFAYFLPIGKKIDAVAADYHERTGEFIRNYEVLKDELNKKGVDLGNLKDRWNHPYRIEFGVNG